MSRCRIINGKFKRRYISVPETKATRPTSDIVKQAVFNVLIHRFKIDFSNTFVIDLFAGSGSLGIESISCGCKKALFIESGKIAVECIRSNIKNLQIEENVTVIWSLAEKVADNIFRQLSECFTNILVFLDPPYSEKALLKSQIDRFTELYKSKNLMIIAESNIEMPNATSVIRHGDTFANVILCDRMSVQGVNA